MGEVGIRKSGRGGHLTSWAIGAICAIAATLGQGATATAVTPAQELAAAKVAIDAANSDWLPAMRAHDAARVAAPYAEDGLFVGPDGSVVRGRAAVARMMAERFASAGSIVSASIRSDGVQYVGGSVLEWGHGDVSRRGKDGRVTSSSSRYVTIWRRDAKGVWRIQRNIVL